MAKIKYPAVMPSDDKKAIKRGKAVLKQMTPKEFLHEARPLKVGHSDQDIIHTFEDDIEASHNLGPLKLYKGGKEDGRHRAKAAKKLGVKKVPVVDYRVKGKKKKAAGGAINVPNRLPLDDEDTNAAFRRLISWSFATAPLFGRAEGGAVEGDVQFAPEQNPDHVKRALDVAPRSSAEEALAPMLDLASILGTKAVLGARKVPEQASEFVNKSVEAAKLPGDVVMGNVDPMSDEGIRRAVDLAGLVTSGSSFGTRPAGALASGASREVKEALAMDEASRLARADEMGFSGPWYHGSQRTDRLLEGKGLNPKRATSGPMPFFTSDPDVASNYAIGKQDTSRMAMDEGDVSNYFTVDPKSLGMRGKSQIPVERTWNLLPTEIKQKIKNNLGRIGYANMEEAEGDFVLHPEFGGLSDPSHYDYILNREARGNPLTALRKIWYEGGDLVHEPNRLADIYKLAGYPYEISQVNAPWTEAKGVMPAMLRMANPLTTHNVEEINEKVIPHLEEAFKKDRTRKATGSQSDMWDKNYRYTPKEWVAQLKEDMAKGDNSYAWTSIPDKVTEQLKAIGYDGIIDTGGKGGGQSHTVAIPFHPHQVRSKFAKFDPEHIESPDLMKHNGGSIVDHALEVLSKHRK